MRKVVISQPMLFPWVGLFEQIRLADVFVYYDDVQFSKGSFVNRVQIKHETGSKWMTIPLIGGKYGQQINEINVDDRKDWRSAHLALLKQTYAKAPYREDMLNIVGNVYGAHTSKLNEIAIASMEAVCEYFRLKNNHAKILSSTLGIGGSNSDRVLRIVQHYDGTEYITGQGARNYLDHQTFEDAGIQVEYLDYLRSPYPQLHGGFDPHVSILDLIANLGKDGVDWIKSGTKNWKEVMDESKR